MVRRVALVRTGGTIEKTYDPLAGVLKNAMSNLDFLLASLELRGVELIDVPLMNKDSLDMTEEELDEIAATAIHVAEQYDGAVIVHGTDRLADTGERIYALGPLPSPVVLTGAMKPFELRATDAVQNITEALLAVQLLEPGVYVAMHNRVLKFPGVVKDHKLGTFVAADEAE